MHSHIEMGIMIRQEVGSNGSCLSRILLFCFENSVPANITSLILDEKAEHLPFTLKKIEM
jgi:hypothetical protein